MGAHPQANPSMSTDRGTSTCLFSICFIFLPFIMSVTSIVATTRPLCLLGEMLNQAFDLGLHWPRA